MHKDDEGRLEIGSDAYIVISVSFLVCSMFARRPTWLGGGVNGKEGDGSSGADEEVETGKPHGRLIDAEDRATGTNMPT